MGFFGGLVSFVCCSVVFLCSVSTCVVMCVCASVLFVVVPVWNCYESVSVSVILFIACVREREGEKKRMGERERQTGRDRKTDRQSLKVAISRQSQCSTTGVTKAVVCDILCVGWLIL